MIKKITLLILLCMFLVESAAAQEGQVYKIEHEGRERSYFVHVPALYDQATPAPLIIVLHGAGSDGLQMMLSTNLNELANETNVIMAYPDGVLQGWNYLDADEIHPDDVYTNDWDLVNVMIDNISADYTIDPSKIFVIGFSNGGMLAIRTRCELADRLAGVVVVAANLSHELAYHCVGADPVSTMLILGTRDELFPWQGYADVTSDGRMRTRFSIAQTMPFFSGLNKCGTQSQITSISLDISPISVVRELFTGCADDTRVALYALIDAGHGWPNGLVIRRDNGDTGDIRHAIWDFLFEEGQ